MTTVGTGKSGVTIRALITAFAILVVSFGAVAPQTASEVEAHHQGAITIRGVIYNTNGARLAGANVYLYNSANQLVRSTTTDTYGRYAIAAGRGHTLQLRIRKQYGTDCSYGGKIIVGVNSVYFTPNYNWANPTYANYQVSILYQC